MKNKFKHRIKHRLYDDEMNRMYYFVKGYEYNHISGEQYWLVWHDTPYESPDKWPVVRLPREKLSVMSFINLFDSTKWNELSDHEQSFWGLMGYSKDNWPGKEIYMKDIITEVNSIGKKTVKRVYYLGPHYCLIDGSGCISEIPNGKSKLYVIGNSKENLDLIE